MKKLILSALASIAIVISSCNQNSPAPAPAPAAAPAPTPTTTATSSMTATETLLVGDWIWDKTETYTNGSYSSAITPTTTWTLTGTTYWAGSHMVLKSSIHTNLSSSGNPNLYNADFYSGPNAASGSWVVSSNPNGTLLGIPNQMPGTAGGYIITLNANTLIHQEWASGAIANGNKAYYHK